MTVGGRVEQEDPFAVAVQGEAQVQPGRFGVVGGARLSSPGSAISGRESGSGSRCTAFLWSAEEVTFHASLFSSPPGCSESGDGPGDHRVRVAADSAQLARGEYARSRGALGVVDRKGLAIGLTPEEPRQLAETAPGDWHHFTIDLWENNGDFTLTGIALTTMGGSASFDRIELFQEPPTE